MYCKFYQLSERPFNVTSDPVFFYSSQRHREALAHLSFGVNQRKGIIAITGEIGTGKTTLCRFFLDQLGQSVKTAFILNPYFPEAKLFDLILRDFGIDFKHDSSLSYLWEFNKFLLAESQQGNNVVLIIDEAQNLSPEQLEQVRLLSNLETKKDKLIQIVLVGQPELNRKLSLHELRQLQQRITVRYHISPLKKDEVFDYITHRLNVAGCEGKIKFTDEAVVAISELSLGTPRLINIICDRALLAGFVAETSVIDLGIINKCSEELSDYLLNKSEVK